MDSNHFRVKVFQIQLAIIRKRDETGQAEELREEEVESEIEEE